MQVELNWFKRTLGDVANLKDVIQNMLFTLINSLQEDIYVILMVNNL